jgi:hypothetical protein
MPRSILEEHHKSLATHLINVTNVHSLLCACFRRPSLVVQLLLNRIKRCQAEE